MKIQFQNTSLDEDVQVRIVPRENAITPSETESNPSVTKENGNLSFCLQKATKPTYSFLELTDTPETYENSDNKLVQVSLATNSLRFIDVGYTELVANASSPPVYSTIASYVTARTFTLNKIHPHIGACSQTSKMILNINRIRGVNIPELIGTVNYVNRVAQINLMQDITTFNPGDVLTVEVAETAAVDNRVNLTLIAKFELYDLGI